MRVALKPHPQSPPSPVSGVEVEVERGEGDLKLTYRAFGDLERVLLPDSTDGKLRRADELWKHTCFEAFLKPVGEPGYLEFNFATSLRWAAYRFEAERLGMRPAPIEPWSMFGRILPSSLEMEVDIAPGRFAEPDLPAPDWRLGLSAVIEDVDGGVSYWALAHPSARPDFHHPDSFTLVLPAPEHA